MPDPEGRGRVEVKALAEIVITDEFSLQRQSRKFSFQCKSQAFLSAVMPKRAKHDDSTQVARNSKYLFLPMVCRILTEQNWDAFCSLDPFADLKGLQWVFQFRRFYTIRANIRLAMPG